MAQIQVLRCQNCTSPLPAGVTKCPKCGAEHQIIPERINPLRCNPAEALEFKDFFEKQTKANPHDTNSLFGMGLVYLGLHNFELAERNLKQAVDLTPGNPDVYYYYALSLFRKRSATLLSDKEADRIEEWLQTAVKIQPKRKYLILQMILRQGAFKGKGKALLADKDEPEQLLKLALQTVQEEDELYEIQQYVAITDARSGQLVEELKRSEGVAYSSSASKSAGDGGGMEEYSSLFSCPKGEDEHRLSEEAINRLNSVEERRNFFHGLTKPVKPEYEKKPAYYRNAISHFWGLVISFIMFLVILLFQDCTHSHFSERCITHPEIAKNLSRYQHIADSLNKRRSTPQYEKEEIKRYLDNAKKNYEINQHKDSVFLSNRSEISEYRIKDTDQGTYDVYRGLFSEKEADSTKFKGMPTPEIVAQAESKGKYLYVISPRNDIWLLICILILLSPLLIWGYNLFSDLIGCWRTRERITQDNKAKKEDYESRVASFNSRVSIDEYLKFCQLFIGPNTGLVTQGDVVAEALRQNRISEGDIIKGKVYLFNGLHTNGRSNSNDPVSALKTIYIEIAIAMPDQLYLIKGTWDTTSNEFPTFQRVTRRYNTIGSIKSTVDTIMLLSNETGNVQETISTSYEGIGSLFRYQSVDQCNMLTYSRTRTTDGMDFLQSINNMYLR